MNRVASLLLLISPLILGQKPGSVAKRAAADPVAVAGTFLPPNCQLATLYRFDYRRGQVESRRPAVLRAHLVSGDSNDIVFAYYCPQIRAMGKTLFLDLLHATGTGYVKAYEISYRAHVLFVPGAIRIVHLRGMSTEAIVIMTAMGAAIGGQLDVLVWDDPRGWLNIFPQNSGMEYFYFFHTEEGVQVALSSAHHPGLNVSPPPVWYQWDGKRFVKIPSPVGSSKWPLPD